MATFPSLEDIAQQSNAYYEKVQNELRTLVEDDQGMVRGDVAQANFDVNYRASQNGVQRTPWIMSTTEWLLPRPPRAPKALLWAANPSDITWTMAQRAVHVKNLYGTVMHVWPDTRRGTFFDEFRLSLNFQSGNIMPVYLGNRGAASETQASNWQLAPGLVNFYDFMQLVDAPKLTTPINGVSRANLVSLQYSSNLFPKLTLLGMFDASGIRFTDTSSTPNQVASWTAEFIVYQTIPSLTDNTGVLNTQLLSTWLAERIPNIRIGTPAATG